MTILFFSRLFYPRIGGVEKHVLEVGKRLVKYGYRVIVVTEEIDKNCRLNDLNHFNKQNQTIRGIEVVRMAVGENNWFKKFRIWGWLWGNRSLIKQADIVHCHDVFFWYLPFRFLYPQKSVYTTFHGYETKFPPTKKAILVRKISEKLSFGNICVGDYIKKWYGTKPDYTTYGGVQILPTPLSGANTTNTTNKKLKILFIGRLEQDMGINTYLKALEILGKKGVDFEFEVCGDGLLRKKIERWGKVYGFVPSLIPYLTGSDLIFASSYLSILEALAAKKLTLATFDNPLKEDYLKIAPFAKWVVIENSAKKLVEKIVYFLNNPTKCEEITGDAYQWAKQQSWDRVGVLYSNLWRLK